MPRGDELWRRLESAHLPELHKLCEIVRVSDAEAKSKPVLVGELSKAIRAAAGHYVVNLFRQPHAFPYKQLLIDVADKMAPGWTFLSWTKYKLNDLHSAKEIEETAWRFFEMAMEKKLKNIPEKDKDELRKNVQQDLLKLGYSQALATHISAGLTGAGVGALVGPVLAYNIALNTASGLAWVQLYWVGKASLLATLGGVVSVSTLIYAPVFAWWLGSPSYRKTVPATLHLIQIRKLREIEDALTKSRGS
jgi:uncharacterized protein YaaW (UPF0174 family)